MLMCPQSPALASEAHNDLDCCRRSPTLLPETTKLLFVLLASVGHKNISHVPHCLLGLSYSLTRMKSFSVEKYVSLLINFFWMAGGAAAQLFFLFISELSVTLCYFLLSSYQNYLWVDILLSWNTSYEDINLFPAAPLLFGAIVWLKTLQGERRTSFSDSVLENQGLEFSLTSFLFIEILIGSSLGTFLVDSHILFSLLFFLWFFWGFARTEWLGKPKSPVIKNAALSWGELFAVFSQVLFFFFPEKIWRSCVNFVCRWNNVCSDLKAALHQNNMVLDNFLWNQAVTSGCDFHYFKSFL